MWVFKLLRLSKTLLAHITFVRLGKLPDHEKLHKNRTRTVSRSVNTLVDFQITRRTKTLLAHITFVRFLVRVNTHVVFQMTRFTKTLLAHIAFIRFLVRVNTHVDFSNYQIHENASRTHHIYTVSRSCEYACGFQTIDE